MGQKMEISLVPEKCSDKIPITDISCNLKNPHHTKKAEEVSQFEKLVVVADRLNDVVNYML